MDNWPGKFSSAIFYIIHGIFAATWFWPPNITSDWLLQVVLHTIPCRLTCYSYKFVPCMVCWKQTDTNTWLWGPIVVQCYIQWDASIFRSKYYVQTVTISPYKRLLVIWCIFGQYICEKYHARKAIWKNYTVLALFR